MNVPSETVAVCADDLEQVFGAEGGWHFAWLVAMEMERRWKAHYDHEQQEGKSPRLLADFALASLTHQLDRLHDRAIRYAKSAGWKPEE